MCDEVVYIYIYIARHELITFLLPVIKFIWERESNTYKFPELMYAFITTDKAGSMETTGSHTSWSSFCPFKPNLANKPQESFYY